MAELRVGWFLGGWAPAVGGRSPTGAGAREGLGFRTDYAVVAVSMDNVRILSHICGLGVKWLFPHESAI